MKVLIDLKESSSPIVIENVKNAYTKGALYCVYYDNKVSKFPIADIFRIVEEYVSASTVAKND